MSVVDVKSIVALTNCNMENLSRHDMLEWVNSAVQGQYRKIEELCSGVAYCQLMEQLFPHCIGLKKVKMAARLEHECMHNLKLFQSAFTRLNFEKSVPIDRLVRGRFQDNFEFLQWFKKFYDSYAAGKENHRIKQTATVPKPLRKIGAAITSAVTASLTQKLKAHSSEKSTITTQRERSASPSSVRVLQDDLEQLVTQVTAIEHERNYYYKKLSDIEAFLKESTDKNEHVEWCQRTLQVLYAVDDHAGNAQSEAVALESADL